MNAPEHVATPPLAPPERGGISFLQLGLITPSAFNPRKRFDEAKLEELADNIAKVGVRVPILVRTLADAKPGRPQYEIVAGERRWRASTRLAERAGQRDAVIPAVVTQMDELEARELALTENVQRQDLHPLEEAEGYEGLLLKPLGGGEFKPKRARGYTVDEIAAHMGMSRRYVYGRLKLLSLVPAAREAFFADRINTKVAEALAAVPAEAQEAALDDVLAGWGGEPYSQRQVIDLLQRSWMMRLGKAPFATDDVTLLPAAGACAACPKRTGANPELFGEQIKADSCTDVKCFDAKRQAAHARAIEQHRALGREVIEGHEARKLLPYADAMPKGWYRLDSACDIAANRKPLAHLLGEGFTPSTVADVESRLVVLVRAADARKALKARDLLREEKPEPAAKAGESGSAAGATQRDAGPAPILPKLPKGKEHTPKQVKEARERAIAERVRELGTEAAAARAASADRPAAIAALTAEQFLRDLAVYLLLGDCETSKVLRDLAIADGDIWQGSALEERVRDLPAEKLPALVLCAMLRTEPYDWVEEGYWPAMAEAFAIDAQAIRTQATAEIEERLQQELGVGTGKPGAKKKGKPAKPTKAAKAAPAAAPDATAAFVAAHAGEAEGDGSDIDAEEEATS